jgi:hypothetical protein
MQERAVYGVLSGDLESVLPMCHSWDDHLWAHLNHKIVNKYVVQYYAKDETNTANRMPVPELTQNCRLFRVTGPTAFNLPRASTPLPSKRTLEEYSSE